jgi:hypothetical protein
VPNLVPAGRRWGKKVGGGLASGWVAVGLAIVVSQVVAKSRNPRNLRLSLTRFLIIHGLEMAPILAATNPEA